MIDAPATKRAFCIHCNDWHTFKLIVSRYRKPGGQWQATYTYVCSVCGKAEL